MWPSSISRSTQTWSAPGATSAVAGSKRRWQQLEGKHEVRVTWKPYQLNPWVPVEGMDRAEYRKMKFGSAERSSGMDTRLVDAGRVEGIDLHFDRIKRTPNTLAAHRLIWLAEQQGRQIEMVDTLFQAYFTDGKDIGDVAQARGAGRNRRP